MTSARRSTSPCRRQTAGNRWSCTATLAAPRTVCYHDLSQELFEAFPCPILEITLRYRKRWEIASLKPRSPKKLSDEQADDFATALDEFSRKVWRKRRKQKAARYDLAILCDPEEAMPPSDMAALKRFIRAGKEVGVDCEVIRQRDYLRLPEYDGLFIRTTTNIDHYTYRFAKKAENEGLVVIDDSNSILRCTNKIYLADLFRINKVPSPKTVVLYKDQPGQLAGLEQALGFPIVVKIPDGAFSKGVEKATNPEELAAICKKLFRHSTLLLAQEFLYTDFDWRIGVLDNQPLFACRYYMVKNHWQIYRHGKRTDSGGFDTMPIADVPAVHHRRRPASHQAHRRQPLRRGPEGTRRQGLRDRGQRQPEYRPGR